MTVSTNGLGGLTIHFDLRNSLVTDGTGNITSVNPMITFRALQVPSDPDWEIDELRGTAVSVSAPNSFVLQRVGGRQFTIDVKGQTGFDGLASSINNLPTGALVEVSGKPQQDSSILTDEVESYTAVPCGDCVEYDPVERSRDEPRARSSCRTMVSGDMCFTRQ